MITILRGDNTELLPTLTPASVQAIVTSPPYSGLRDYGIPPTAWPTYPGPCSKKSFISNTKKKKKKKHATRNRLTAGASLVLDAMSDMSTPPEKGNG